MNENRVDFETAADVIEPWRRIAIVTHARPDGDALGSVAGMSVILTALNKQPVPIVINSVPVTYSDVFAGHRFEVWNDTVDADSIGRLDGIIIVDTCSASQLQPVTAWLQSASVPKLVVDHHVSRDPVADYYLIDEKAAAACLIVWEWARAVGWQVSPQAARALFVGIATDTGWFQHANADSRVFRAAADLIDAGLKPNELYQQLYMQDAPQRLLLLGKMLNTLELDCDGRLAAASITQTMLKESMADPSHVENLVNEPMRIGSVVAMLLFVEQGDGIVRVSFRSKRGVDVASLAQRFGGGGHTRAAGAKISGTLAAVREQVLPVVRREVRDAG